MLLEGSIHRFNLAGVLQFLAQGAATGVLEVRDFEEYGFIYLVDGRVEAISLPITDEKLGTRLVKAGCLTEQQLAEALMEDAGLSHDQKKFKPLGQRLIEKGYTTRERDPPHHGAADAGPGLRARALDRTACSSTTSPSSCRASRWRSRATCRACCSTPTGASTRASARARPRNVVDNEVCYACPLERGVRRRDQDASTSRRTCACGARWPRCSTRAATACATRASSTAPARRTRSRSSTPPWTPSSSTAA